MVAETKNTPDNRDDASDNADADRLAIEAFEAFGAHIAARASFLKRPSNDGDAFTFLIAVRNAFDELANDLDLNVEQSSTLGGIMDQALECLVDGGKRNPQNTSHTEPHRFGGNWTQREKALALHHRARRAVRQSDELRDRIAEWAEDMGEVRSLLDEMDNIALDLGDSTPDERHQQPSARLA